MKIIMNRKEARELEGYLKNISGSNDAPQLPKSIMDSYHTTTGDYVIEIKPKYITAVLGEVNTWLPSIIFAVKSLISLLEASINRITDVELSIINEETANEENKQE